MPQMKYLTFSVLFLAVFAATSVCRGAEAETQKALFDAIRKGNLETVQQSIDDGANLESKSGGGNTPLGVAVNGQKVKIVEYLLRKGADPNATDEGRSPLLSNAVCADNPKLVELLLKAGADPNRPKEKANLLPIVNLIMMKRCNEKVLDLLLKHGADINVKVASPGGYNILGHFLRYRTALSTESDRAVRLFVSKGIDIKQRDDKGQTAADLASRNLHVQYLSLLDFEGKYSSLREAFSPTNDSRFQGVWTQKEPLEIAVLYGKGRGFFRIGERSDDKETIVNTSLALGGNAEGTLFVKKGRTLRFLWSETNRGIHISVVQGAHRFYEKYPLEAILRDDGVLELLYCDVRIPYAKADAGGKE